MSTYPTASHTSVSTFLGGSVTEETSSRPPTAPCPGGGSPSLPPDADGDTGDDGVTFPSYGTGDSVLLIAQTNTLTLQASAAGLLSAWIDLNRDGDWADTGEQIFDDIALPAGSSNLQLTGAQLPSNVPHGAAYMRFRFCDTPGSCNNAGGTSANGEVEDYRVFIALPDPATSSMCSAGLNNGSFESPVTTSPVGRIQAFAGGRIGIFKESFIPGWGFNAIRANAGRSFDQRNAVELWQSGAGAAPGNPNAYGGNQFAEINAYVSGNLQQDTLQTRGTAMKWAFAHRARGRRLGQTDRMAVRIGAPGATVKQADFTSRNQQTGAADCLIGNALGGIGVTAEERVVNGTFWCFYTGDYDVPAGSDTAAVIRFEFQSEATGSGNTSIGNFIDIVSFDLAGDRGDAPVATYGAACHLPVSSTTSTLLGTLWDSEAGEQGGNAAADIDDSNGIDDEDGVTFSAGGAGDIGATVTGSNDSGTAAMLCGYLDGANEGLVNGTFDRAVAYSAGQVGLGSPVVGVANEEVCIQVPSTAGTTSVSLGGLSNPASADCATTGNGTGVDFDCTFFWDANFATAVTTYARFRFTTDPDFFSNSSPSPAGFAMGGEVEDHRLSIDPTAVTIGKVELEVLPAQAALDLLDPDTMTDTQLLDLLAMWDPAAASALSGESRSAALAALLSYLDPNGDGQAVILRWETLQERGTIGFYAERRESGKASWQRLNGGLLPGLIAAPLGGEYWLADPEAQPGKSYEYRLIELEAWGTQRSYGPWHLRAE